MPQIPWSPAVRSHGHLCWSLFTPNIYSPCWLVFGPLCMMEYMCFRQAAKLKAKPWNRITLWTQNKDVFPVTFDSAVVEIWIPSLHNLLKFYIIVDAIEVKIASSWLYNVAIYGVMSTCIRKNNRYVIYNSYCSIHVCAHYAVDGKLMRKGDTWELPVLLLTFVWTRVKHAELWICFTVSPQPKGFYSNGKTSYRLSLRPQTGLFVGEKKRKTKTQNITLRFLLFSRTKLGSGQIFFFLFFFWENGRYIHSFSNCIYGPVSACVFSTIG